MRKSSFLVTLLCFTYLLFGSAQILFAATISITPANSVVSQGDIFSVSVITNTQGVSVNNSDAVINFPNNLVDVVSIGKSSSVFSLWVEDPSFSNQTGTITFDGGVPNPGFTGPSGNIITVVFRAKKAGTASIIFSSANVRANDGVGTNVLSSKQSATVTITEAKQPEVISVPVRSDTLPRLPVIISSTHPKSDDWYQGMSASFSWNVPTGVTSIQTLLGKSAKSTPNITYDSSVSQKTIGSLSDGTYYFHLRFMNSIGWGPVAHYKIQVDSTPPDSFSPKVRIEGTFPFLTLNAHDATSGVDYYLLGLDDGTQSKVKVASLTNGEYQLPVQNGGAHNITVSAYDKAGNHTDVFNLQFDSPAISAPEITLTKDVIQVGESTEVVGTSAYSNTKVVVFVETSKKRVIENTSVTREDGSFTVKTDELDQSGKANVWAELQFSDTVKSPISEKLLLKVNDSKLVQFSWALVSSLLWIIVLILLLLIIFFLLYLGWHKYFGLKKKMDDELEQVIEEIHNTFKLYKEELGERLDELESASTARALNKKEEKIFKQLQNNIDTIDEFIQKKLKKIK